MATQFTGAVNTLWSEAGNWSDGKPDAADAVTIAATAAEINIDEPATCLSLNLTARSNVIVSGASALTIVAGTINIPSGATVTYSGDINFQAGGTSLQCFFGGKTWSGALTVYSNYNVAIRDANTFGSLTIDFTGVSDGCFFDFRGNTTINGDFTIISYCGTTAIAHNRPLISSSRYFIGNGYTLTVGGTISITGAVDFEDIHAAGAASWDFSLLPIGNCGGNTGITFRDPQTFYAVLGTDSMQFYGNGGKAVSYDPCYATTSGGVASYANIFLPQDTLIIDDNTWNDGVTGKYIIGHSYTRTGNVDASGLTKAGNVIDLPRYCFGNIDYSGSGVTAYTANPYNNFFSPRLKNEQSEVLTVKLKAGFAFHASKTFSVGEYDGTGGTSSLGTVKLLSDITVSLAYLQDSTLDLNGFTLTCNKFISIVNLTRTLIDSAGGGKIILTGLNDTTNEVFDTANTTGLTVSNAPDIQIGDGTKTLTGNTTFMGAGKIYGDLTIKKHAGNFDCIITGSNEFGTITLETPDATYQYSDIQFTAGTTTTCTDFVADGTADYPINIDSASDATHTLSCTTGEISVSNCVISYSIAEGGADWIASITNGNTDGGNNTGWDFDALGRPIKISLGGNNMILRHGGARWIEI